MHEYRTLVDNKHMLEYSPRDALHDQLGDVLTVRLSRAEDENRIVRNHFEHQVANEIRIVLRCSSLKGKLNKREDLRTSNERRRKLAGKTKSFDEMKTEVVKRSLRKLSFASHLGQQSNFNQRDHPEYQFISSRLLKPYTSCPRVA